MRFAALGRTRWLLDSIRHCVDNGHRIVLVGTAPAAPEYGVSPADFRDIAERHGCPFFCQGDIDGRVQSELMADSRAEVCISVNWPTLFRREVLRLFPHGVINAHAGDLPRFRGNACPNWAILVGEPKVTVTLHRMTIELDAGPILRQRNMALGEQTYIRDIYRFMDASIPPMFLSVLDDLSAGHLVAREQPAGSQASLRCYPRRPRDSEIEWQRPAADLARLVRASAEPFCGAYTWYSGEKLTVWRARAEVSAAPSLGVPGQVVDLRPAAGEACVLTSDGSLVLEEVSTQMHGRVRATDVLRSTRARLGMDLTTEIVRLRERLAVLEAAMARRTDRDD